MSINKLLNLLSQADILLFNKLNTFLQKADHYKDVKRQSFERSTEKRFLSNIPDKPRKSRSVKQDPTAILKAANEVAMSQLSTRPKFMQNLNRTPLLPQN